MASYGRGEFDGFSSYQTSSASSRQGVGGGGEFERLVNSVSNNIQKITQNVAQIQTNVNRIGTSQDTPEIRDRVHQLQHYTNQIAKDTNRDLKELAHLHVSPSDQSKWKVQKERLTDEFSTALKNFQTIQRTAAEKEKASVARARAHSGMGKGSFEDDFGGDTMQMTPGYSQTRQVLQMEEDVDLEMLQERETAIKQLERDITDVNQIFKDLGMLVHEQGDMLDSIESNVENAQVKVEEGTKQLGKAVTYQIICPFGRDVYKVDRKTKILEEHTSNLAIETDDIESKVEVTQEHVQGGTQSILLAAKYQSKARRKKCICITILIIVLIIVIIIIAVVVSQKSGN